jgi:hypothetical protein
MSNFRYLNGALIAYIVVSLVNLFVLAGIDTKLPRAFFIALTTPDFWLRNGGGAEILPGAIFILMWVAYIATGRVESCKGQLISGLTGALLCTAFYGITLFVLLLSGLRH